jgi:GTP pyrophosphokinase
MDGVKKTKTQSKFLDVITIKGSEDMAVELASCCHPIPGDPILGYINKGKGLIIHTHDCPVIRKFNLDPERWVDVEWEPNADRLYKVSLNILVSNERGMLAQMAAAISEASSNIENVNLEESDGSNFVNINFVVQVKNRIHLAEIIRSLRKINKISRIIRVKVAK